MKGLFRTTIHIWTEYDPRVGGLDDLSNLAREAEEGDGFCDYLMAQFIDNPIAAGLNGDGQEFFEIESEIKESRMDRREGLNG